MSVGIIILAHRDLHRVAQLSRALAQRGCRIVIHVDANTPDADFNALTERLNGNRRISFATRVPCEWGGFSLVQAGLMAATTLIDRWPEVSHVCQISGSCLPTRPINELSAFLAANEGVDFVESVPARGQANAWVVDGLEMERFTLHFPFSYHTQRRLFDAFVNFQRHFRIRRKIPQGLEPHVGSQWWCLSRPTLEAILSDPRRHIYDRYFRSCWIPDEGYVPTMVRRHGQRVVSRSLTLSRFDDQGKPYIFYDDHEELLRNSDAFFARKIWAGSNRLYRRFLSQKSLSTVRNDRDPGLIEEAFANTHKRRCEARPGRVNQGRFPANAHQHQPSTAAPYRVLQGFTHLYEDLPDWIAETTGKTTFGRVFRRGAVGFQQPDTILPGGLPATPEFRDYNPEQYLTNLIWNAGQDLPVLLHDISDNPRINRFLANDPKAQLTVITGSWALDLFRRPIPDDRRLRKYAVKLLTQETRQLAELRKGRNPQAHVFSLATGLGEPGKVLGSAFGLTAPITAPSLRDFDGFAAFVERLENLGISVEGLGRIKALEKAPAQTPELRVVSGRA